MMKKCPIEFIVSLVSGKWKILIMKELSHGALRYGKLAELITGISPKVLIAQLRELEDDGLIDRTVYPEVPPRVEYSLSRKGENVFTVFFELRRLGLEVGEGRDSEGIPNAECGFCEKCIPYIKK